ncbi:MAG: hypothetical protein OEL66_09300, partial [Desulfobulbaceae bacterium]|nr:hypothetical protein [Desulfobulbaceae bacterium]
AAKQVPVAVGEREVLGRKVRESVQKGKYKEALAAYDKLANDPSGQIGIAVQQAYVVALLRTNKADSALVELQKLIEQSGDFDSWTVRRQVADLLMATGKQEAAVAGYQELLVAYNALEKDREWVQGQLDLLADNSEGRGEELSVYGEVLRAYLTFDGKRVPGELKMWVARLEYKYPDSPFAVKSRQLLVRVESEAKSWISDKLLGVDALVEARQFKKALAALEDLLGQNLPKEMTDVVREAMGKVVIVEARYQEDMRTQIDERLQKRWLEAVHLYDSEQFDEAMVVFSSLYGTPYDVDARVKIGDAAALAAAKLRKKAATLFFKAGQATDSGSKKELLLQSRQLLQEIMAKYPYVDLIDKVSRNLQIIDEQLLVADPLSYPSMGGGDDQEAGEVTDDAASEESW